jgi:hypothetical protein
MTTNNSRIDNQSKDQKMIAGIDKHLKSLPSILIGSQNMTPAAIIQIFQDRIATGQRAQSARAAWLETVKADRSKRAQTAPIVAAFKRAVEGVFYDATSTLDDFGLTPVKKPKTKVDTKAAAAAKTRATRKVRGTLGKKQKKAVKGTTPNASTGSTASTPTATGPAPAAPTPKPNA